MTVLLALSNGGRLPPIFGWGRGCENLQMPQMQAKIPQNYGWLCLAALDASCERKHTFGRIRLPSKLQILRKFVRQRLVRGSEMKFIANNLTLR